MSLLSRLGPAAMLVAALAIVWAIPERTPPAEAAPAPSGAPSGVPIVAGGEAFTCTPVRVWDGDGPIWCAEGPRIRLAGIAAREMDGSCRPGHPCPDADPIAARDHLVSLIGTPTGTAAEGHVLVRGERLSCRSDGGAGGTRTAAWCSNSTAGDLSRAMVRDGYAARWDRYWRQ